MGLFGKFAGGALAAGAAAVAWTRALEARSPMLPAPVAGVPHRFPWRHADIYLTVRGEGPAALLLHDLYTGASGAEMGPLGDRLAETFTVVTPDLPGFGRSGRPSMRYRPDFYRSAIVELVRHAIDRPALLVASGLSAAFAVGAAVELREDIRGVVMLGPPEPDGPAPITPPAWGPIAYQALRSPLGRAYHYWHANPLVQRRTLAAALAGDPADLAPRAEARARYARQRNGHWPLWSLWAGDLAIDPRDALAKLEPPALLLWGAEARGNPAAPELYRAVREDAVQSVLPGTARWPHVDRPELAAAAIRDWWTAEPAPGPEATPGSETAPGSETTPG
ncbi:MAG TPA: alpha/beta hydrolase [Gemmatimonadota bacterium]|nr:alpha/beta hydrolase [Gemmatimonadota bacterium]